jgi:hypothetical protein
VRRAGVCGWMGRSPRFSGYQADITACAAPPCPTASFADDATAAPVSADLAQYYPTVMGIFGTIAQAFVQNAAQIQVGLWDVMCRPWCACDGGWEVVLWRERGVRGPGWWGRGWWGRALNRFIGSLGCLHEEHACSFFV